ncbi:MAG TPA: STAS domain-containing protein [Solirubrobacterales bacterium]|nr:STAS domain-containing protein [Solirubrobacterales bacterium]
MDERWDPHEERDGPLLIRAEAAPGGGHVLALSGELDLKNAETLAVEIAKSGVADGDSLTIDLGGLEFIDSTGIALLVSVFRRFNAAGGQLRLVPSRSESVRRVMELTGLDRTLPFDDRKESHDPIA